MMDVFKNAKYRGKHVILTGDIYRPVAPVTFKSLKNNLSTRVWMVVDTGADFSILPKYVARDLQISFAEDCVVDETGGVGGRQKIYLCKTKLSATIGNYERKVEFK